MDKKIIDMVGNELTLSTTNRDSKVKCFYDLPKKLQRELTSDYKGTCTNIEECYFINVHGAYYCIDTEVMSAINGYSPTDDNIVAGINEVIEKNLDCNYNPYSIGILQRGYSMDYVAVNFDDMVYRTFDIEY